MKKPFIVLPFSCLLVCMVVSFGFNAPVKDKVKNKPPKGFAVVELFTSEGCSSCPPADEAVAALVKDYPAHVYVLGFHVDYWNYLGWKDDFSSAAYAERQQQYATAFSLNSIYTPQVIINGRTEFTGSDKTRLYTSVEQELGKDDDIAIELAAKAGNAGAIQVTYKTNAPGKSLLNIALVQLQASSAVKRGENRGKLLQHVDVVRGFKTVTGNSGTVNLQLPEGLLAKDCKIVAFTQEGASLHVSGAGECSLGN